LSACAAYWRCANADFTHARWLIAGVPTDSKMVIISSYLFALAEFLDLAEIEKSGKNCLAQKG
jgi:hypothetical protein